jgi:predicted permease
VLLGIGYGVKPAVAGTTLLFSTVLSAVTLPVLVAVLPRI